MLFNSVHHYCLSKFINEIIPDSKTGLLLSHVLIGLGTFQAWSSICINKYLSSIYKYPPLPTPTLFLWVASALHQNVPLLSKKFIAEITSDRETGLFLLNVQIGLRAFQAFNSSFINKQLCPFCQYYPPPPFLCINSLFKVLITDKVKQRELRTML